MEYTRKTSDMPLTLAADKSSTLEWYVDASFAVHTNMHGHTGAGLTMGRGFPIACSTKLKLNTWSSTESKLVGVDDMMPTILWTHYFLLAQGYKVDDNIVFQDNKSAILLKCNGKSLSTKCTKHINIRYFFVMDKILKREVSIQWCPMNDMIGDFMTNPLQGSQFKQFQDVIMGVEHIGKVHDAGKKSNHCKSLVQG